MIEITMNLNPKLHIPLYEQIYQYIKEDIGSGRMSFGEKLPSTRALSKHLEVSRTTVEVAYEQLLSEGYIEAEPCKGYFVSDVEGLYQQTQAKPVIDSGICEAKKSYRYDFSPNGIDLQSFPYNTWRKLSKEILSDDRSSLFRSGHSQGEEELRIAIQAYLHHARGVNCSTRQIVVGAGNEYLLMLLGLMFGTKQRVAFENPTYKQAYKVFENLGYDITTVDMDKYGMDMEQLQESKADLAYVMPSHQYPLGIVMPIKRRMELLKWASKEEQRYIIEDDYDSEFRYKGKPVPALQGFDKEGKVIYLGTFSRAIAPAIRVSYMVLPEQLVEVYQKKCDFMSCTVPKVDQLVICKFMEMGYFERHLNKMRAIYKNRHDLLLSHLKPLMGECYVTGENAGVHLLLHFPEGITKEELIERAENHSIKVYGLGRMETEGAKKTHATILLGYANMREKDIIEATEILCKIWKS